MSPSTVRYYAQKAGLSRRVRKMTTTVCGHCAKEFSHPAHQRRRYCSTACNSLVQRGETHGSWKGTPSVWSNGYRFVTVPKGHISRSSSRRKRKDRAPEHVVIAEEVLGRPLKANEVVHHINCDKTDNRKTNLLICTRSYHVWLHGEMSRRWAQEHFGGPTN